MPQKLDGKRVTTEVTRALVLHLQAEQADLSDLENQVGCSFQMLSEPESKVPITTELKLWEYTAQKTKNPYVGLLMTRYADLQNLGVLGYLTLQQESLGAMIEAFSRYHQIMHEEAIIGYRRDANFDILEHGYSELGDGPGQHPSDFTMGSFWKILSQAASAPIVLKEIHFQHSLPDSSETYSTFFGPQVRFRFSQLHNRLLFQSGTFDIPTRHSDHRLAQLLESYAQQALIAIPQNDLLEQNLMQAIAELIQTNQLTLDRVASKLGYSRRTLQRRLRERDLRFKEIAEQVQHRIALRYLEDPDLTIAEITYLCGYSEPAAFSRAFKRRIGVSPKEFRNSLCSRMQSHG